MNIRVSEFGFANVLAVSVTPLLFYPPQRAQSRNWSGLAPPSRARPPSPPGTSCRIRSGAHGACAPPLRILQLSPATLAPPNLPAPAYARLTLFSGLAPPSRARPASPRAVPPGWLRSFAAWFRVRPRYRRRLFPLRPGRSALPPSPASRGGGSRRRPLDPAALSLSPPVRHSRPSRLPFFDKPPSSPAALRC